MFRDDPRIIQRDDREDDPAAVLRNENEELQRRLEELQQQQRDLQQQLDRQQQVDRRPAAVPDHATAAVADHAVHRVAVKLSPFWADKPSLWFAQTDSQFVLSNIVNEVTKFLHIVSRLDAQIAAEIEDIISNPPVLNSYTFLRTKLIERLSASEEKRVRQLISEEELGDRKPSQFLRHLRSLAGTNIVQDSLLRQLWLQRLPSSVQAILASQGDSTLEKLAELADKILEITPATPNFSVHAASAAPRHSAFEEKILQAVADLQRQVDTLSSSRSHPSSRDNSHRSHPSSRDNSRRFRQRSPSTSSSAKNSNHNSRICCHPGARATIKLVTDRFVWPSVKKDCRNWARACIECQRSKVTRHVHAPIAFLEGAISSNRPTAQVEKNSRKMEPEARTSSADVGRRVYYSGGSVSTRESTDKTAPRCYPKGWSPKSELLVLLLTNGVSLFMEKARKKMRGARKMAKKQEVGKKVLPGLVGRCRA
ncbi:unnamed protein product [Trichogramma brassicae]|uniref:Uncharacterized protein n=1 Tax=Trichogramma brassicae TaxID=86971 RepID=A0A6H5I673_9HYME|nr:unnamed protein product [Trichogramma brassicae]